LGTVIHPQEDTVGVALTHAYTNLLLV